MIQANELRIGNYVYLFDNTNDFLKIHTISRDVLQVEGTIIGGEVYKIENVTPIKLNSEILEMFGFVKCGHLTYEIVNKSLSCKYRISNTGYGHVYHGIHTTYPINYLHQLQNLYFALSGEELTITT